MRLRVIQVAVATSCLIAGCSDSPTGIQLPVTVSGTIQNRSGATIPANARPVVLWGVSATDPDYSYVFGEGTVNPTTGEFSITFFQELPAAALNQGTLGVGLVILTSDDNLQEGIMPAGYDFSTVIGATEDHSIIFRKGSVTGFENAWPADFPLGYSVGEVERQTTGFDTFKKVALDVLRLVIDDLANITVPNWT